MIANTVSREALLDVVRTLPAAPQILAQLGLLLQDLNSDLSDVTDLLKRDAALTARIIRVSNSPLYNTGRPFASLDEALARVGFTEVYRLTGFAAAAQLSDRKLTFYGVSGVELRENSVLTALIMESLARVARANPQQAYTAGLLRSTGKIALDRLAKNAFPSGAFALSRATGVADWESSHAGITNCEAAGIIMVDWRFPEETAQAIREQYQPTTVGHPLSHLLNLAAGSAERCGFGLAGETVYWDTSPVNLSEVGIDEDALHDAVERALESFNSIRAAVG